MVVWPDAPIRCDLRVAAMNQAGGATSLVILTAEQSPASGKGQTLLMEPD